MLNCSCSKLIKQLHERASFQEEGVVYISFERPKQKSYSLVENDFEKRVRQRTVKKKEKHSALTNVKYEFKHSSYPVNLYKWLNIDSYKVQKKNGKSIVAVYITNKSARDNELTLLYSQGSKTDLGSVFPMLLDLSNMLKINIVAYDYSGYGESEGIPTESEICNDIEEVADFIKSDLKISFDKVVLFSYSLGSIPSIHLASSDFYRNILKGMILLSPVGGGGAGVKIVNPSVIFDFERLSKISCFNYDSKLKNICCLIFLIHGKKDEKVPFKNAENLLKLNSKITEWFPGKGDHTNIQSKLREKFYNKISFYLEQLRYLLKDKGTMFNNSNSNINQNSYTKCIIRLQENYIRSDNSVISEKEYKLLKDSPEKRQRRQMSAKKLVTIDKNEYVNLQLLNEESTSQDDEKNHIQSPRKKSEEIEYSFRKKSEENMKTSFYDDPVDLEKNEKLFELIQYGKTSK